jgi:hypothetical protein
MRIGRRPIKMMMKSDSAPTSSEPQIRPRSGAARPIAIDAPVAIKISKPGI